MKSTDADRRWMAIAERMNREDALSAGHNYGDIWYGGGGVYRVGWGVSCRGAIEARAWIGDNRPDFANRVTVRAERR